MSEILEARNYIKIYEIGEPFTPIPSNFFSFDVPHSYSLAGAPYGKSSPYYLRQSVVDRLIVANAALQREAPGYCLHIFDGFRPQAVQVYMRQLEHDRIAQELGWQSASVTPEQSKVLWEKVNLVWAPPQEDPSKPPPPHSTGAALDLTILDSAGCPINMGSDFDEASARILPHYYSNQTDVSAAEVCANRELLNRTMSVAGFHRITHEWWHYSYGDQMWALLESIKSGTNIAAIYGEMKH